MFAAENSNVQCDASMKYYFNKKELFRALLFFAVKSLVHPEPKQALVRGMPRAESEIISYYETFCEFLVIVDR